MVIEILMFITGVLVLLSQFAERKLKNKKRKYYE